MSAESQQTAVTREQLRKCFCSIWITWSHRHDRHKCNNRRNVGSGVFGWVHLEARHPTPQDACQQCVSPCGGRFEYLHRSLSHKGQRNGNPAPWGIYLEDINMGDLALRVGGFSIWDSKYVQESRGTRTQEWLQWQGPASTVNNRTLLLPERVPHINPQLTVNRNLVFGPRLGFTSIDWATAHRSTMPLTCQQPPWTGAA
jgi:hypothetical protein